MAKGAISAQEDVCFQCANMSNKMSNKMSGKYRKRNKKSNNTRRKRNSTNRNVVTRVRGIGFADSMVMTLSYSDRLTRAPGTVTDEYVFTGNGLFDPNVTGTGSQPVYFDNVGAIYTRYRVLSSSVKLDILTQMTAGAGVYYTCFPSLLSTGVSTVIDAMSQRYVKSGFAGPIAAYNRVFITNRSSTKEIFGVNSIYEDDYSAAFNANPLNIWYWVLNAYSSNTDVVLWGFIITINYHVEFYERIQTDLSLYALRVQQHQRNLLKMQQRHAHKNEIGRLMHEEKEEYYFDGI